MIGEDQIRAIQRIHFVALSPVSLTFVIVYPQFFDTVPNEGVGVFADGAAL
jgi:hypothetical protein